MQKFFVPRRVQQSITSSEGKYLNWKKYEPLPVCLLLLAVSVAAIQVGEFAFAECCFLAISAFLLRSPITTPGGLPISRRAKLVIRMGSVAFLILSFVWTWLQKDTKQWSAFVTDACKLPFGFYICEVPYPITNPKTVPLQMLAPAAARVAHVGRQKAVQPAQWPVKIIFDQGACQVTGINEAGRQLQLFDSTSNFTTINLSLGIHALTITRKNAEPVQRSIQVTNRDNIIKIRCDP